MRLTQSTGTYIVTPPALGAAQPPAGTATAEAVQTLATVFLKADWLCVLPRGWNGLRCR